MWTYSNPVNIIFGPDQSTKLPELIAGRRYAQVTYPDAPFAKLSAQLEAAAGATVLKIEDVAPIPDYDLLANQSARFPVF